MNTAVELVSNFRRKGVRFAIEGDQLRYWAPSGSLSPAELGSLRALKGEIISLLGESAVSRPQLQRCAEARRLPSLEQLDWWDSIRRGLYTEPYWLQLTSVVRWRGPLDTAALDQAVTAVFARHEIMRTRFDDSDGQLAVLVDAPEPIHVELRDLSALAPEARESEARSIATDVCRSLFAGLGDRLFRTCLLRLSAEDHVFVVVVHHIITDAQSMAMLQHELQTLYGAHAGGAAARGALPQLQYGDYSAWQHSWMTPARQRAYLVRLKNRAAGPASFPVDPGAEVTDTPTRVICPFVLSTELVAAVQRFARAAGTTQYLVVLTALKIALAQWTQRAQVTVASVGSLRIHEGLMDMLGPFACLDLVSTDLADAPHFREALARVMKSYSESQDFRPYAHALEYVPLVNVFVDYIRDFGRDTSAPALASGASGSMHMQSLSCEEFPLLPVPDRPMRQWALIFLAREHAGRIEGRLSCSSAQFSSATLQRALDRLQRILEDCVRDADAPIGTIASEVHHMV